MFVRIKVVCAVLIWLVLLPGAALAQKFFRSSGDWSAISNWSDFSCETGGALLLPDCEDHVVICSGVTAEAGGTSVALSVDVEAGAVLEVEALQLCGTGVTSTIDGVIEVGGILALDWNGGIGNTHTFAGSGELIGGGGEIQIEGTGELINSMYMHGAFTMSELTGENTAGNLNMIGGIIEADSVGGLIDIDVRMVVDSEDVDSYFLVTNTDSVLRFRDDHCVTPCASICLWRTYFDVLEGKLDLQRPVSTRARLTIEPGGKATTDNTAGGVFHLKALCTD